MTAAVLLVEDELLVRELIQDALDERGLIVLSAGDGQAACRRLEQAEPRVLVTDINLGPGPDGFDVAKRGRELRPDLKVVYITGHAEHLVGRGVAGAEMVPKPFDLETLAARVAWLATR